MDHSARPSDRPLDLVLLGATGFVGRQCAAHLARHAPPGMRWAVAGRDRARLEAARAAAGATSAELRVVDTADAAAVEALVAEARVVLTTVGPYAKYGDAVLGACARLGTDYVDITGETPWVRRMIDQHHEAAVASGARIVPFCGFDSVPSDLGVWMLVEWIRATWGEPVREVRAAFSAKGGFNGGTLDSALTLRERGDLRMLADPFLLNPADRRPGPAPARSKDPRGTVSDPALGTLAPFFMAPVNTRVVRRSHAIFASRGQDYGPDFVYQEYMRPPGGAVGAWVMMAGMGAFFALSGKPWGRDLLRRFAPKPGEGPSEAQMDAGGFKVELVAEAQGGRTVRGKVASAGDPGNRVTTKIVCEAALCLLYDRAALPQGAGILTPATAFAAPLRARLEAQGFTFVVKGADGGAAPA
ncbi:MAG: hypothetical protein RL071_3479 [Pseudomonadota bacterium]